MLCSVQNPVLGGPAMICSRVVFSICAFLAALTALPVHADTPPVQLTLPAKVGDALQERAQALSHLTFTWQRSDKEQIFCSLSPSQMKDAREKELEGSEADYRKRGITDEAQIKQYAEENTQNIMAGLEGGSVNYTNTWTLQRNGSATLVSGTTQQFNGFIRTSRQFYENTPCWKRSSGPPRNKLENSVPVGPIPRAEGRLY
jgi:hypothetical protein